MDLEDIFRFTARPCSEPCYTHTDYKTPLVPAPTAGEKIPGNADRTLSTIRGPRLLDQALAGGLLDTDLVADPLLAFGLEILGKEVGNVLEGGGVAVQDVQHQVGPGADAGQLADPVVLPAGDRLGLGDEVVGAGCG